MPNSNTFSPFFPLGIINLVLKSECRLSCAQNSPVGFRKSQKQRSSCSIHKASMVQKKKREEEEYKEKIIGESDWR